MKITALKAGCVLMLSLGVMLGGCSNEAKTPKDAAVNLVKAFEKGDKSLFLATVNIKDEDKEAAGQMFEAMSAAVSFQKEMEKAYGKDAMKGMGRGPADGMPAVEKVEKGTVKEDGDKATVTPADSKEPIDVVKVNGVWKVKFDEVNSKNKDRDIKMAQAMKKAIDSAKAEIGKSGMTAEKVMEKFQKSMMEAMMAK